MVKIPSLTASTPSYPHALFRPRLRRLLSGLCSGFWSRHHGNDGKATAMPTLMSSCRWMASAFRRDPRAGMRTSSSDRFDQDVGVGEIELLLELLTPRDQA